jgi:hypothetical protein
MEQQLSQKRKLKECKKEEREKPYLGNKNIALEEQISSTWRTGILLYLRNTSRLLLEEVRGTTIINSGNKIIVFKKKLSFTC